MRIISTGPMGAPALTLADMRSHLRLDHSQDDALLTSLEASVRDHLQQALSIVVTTRAITLVLDAWPENGQMSIPIGPVKAVTAMRVAGSDGVMVPVAPMFRLDPSGQPASLSLIDPPLPGVAIAGIEIDILAGFGDSGAEVPDSLRRAIMLMVASLYDNAGLTADDVEPIGWQRLLAPFRPVHL